MEDEIKTDVLMDDKSMEARRKERAYNERESRARSLRERGLTTATFYINKEINARVNEYCRLNSDRKSAFIERCIEAYFDALYDKKKKKTKRYPSISK